MNVTFLGTSIELELSITPPSRSTSTVAKPPLNVDMVVDSAFADTKTTGKQENIKINDIKNGDVRFIVVPRRLGDEPFIHVPCPKYL